MARCSLWVITLSSLGSMSALPPKADMCGARGNVCFGPKADTRLVSFDDLVGAAKHRRRHRKAERLRGFEIDYQLELGWRLYRQVGGLLAFEDTIDVAGRLPVQIGETGSIGNQAAGGDEGAFEVDRRELMPCS